MKKCLPFFLLVLACNCCLAQFPAVSLPGSEVRTITSTIVKKQEYRLEILLPSGYATGNKKYPVVYLMDSQWDLPLVKSVYGQQYYDGFIPELIVVGVTWGGDKPNPDSLRARDYTPTNETRLPQSGGADQFLLFMKEELFPFIETNYRVKADERTLMGCSLGGLFTIYTMLTQTNMFTGYAAASPAIGWDSEVLYTFEKQFAAKKLTSPVRLYMTVGDVERGRAGFEKMAKFLSSQPYRNVSIRSKVLENTGHSGTKSETYTRGLQFIFEKPNLTLPEARVKVISGKYKSATGQVVEIRKENNGLILVVSPGNQLTLFAASDTALYAKSELLNIYFNGNSEKTEEMEIESFGGKTYFAKMKD